MTCGICGFKPKSYKQGVQHAGTHTKEEFDAYWAKIYASFDKRGMQQ